MVEKEEVAWKRFFVKCGRKNPENLNPIFLLFPSLLDWMFCSGQQRFIPDCWSNVLPAGHSRPFGKQRLLLLARGEHRYLKHTHMPVCSSSGKSSLLRLLLSSVLFRFRFSSFSAFDCIPLFFAKTPKLDSVWLSRFELALSRIFYDTGWNRKRGPCLE